MAIEDVIEFKAKDFVPYYGKKNYICRTRDFFNSDYQKVIEDKLDTLGLLEGAYMATGMVGVFALLNVYFPLK